MLLAKDIAAVKTAIEICNNPELKREILCAPDDINKGNYQYGSKKQWNEIVEKKATVILKNLGLPEKLQEKVMGIVHLVGVRMLTWAEYHEGTLGLSREYSIDFLNSSFFTQQGIIDNKKAAEELMKDESLNIKQKYKLACLCCFTNHIPALYRQMTKEDKEEFYDTERPKQPELVKFWSYYLMGEIDELKGEKNLDQYRLEKAVESGSKAAVEYCLERTNLRRKKDAIIDAAVEAVKCRVRAGPYTEKDRVVFRNQRYKDSEESWVPSDYYVDILSFLLSKMGEDQQIEFLKKDIEGVKYKREPFEDSRRSRVLEYFLNWPYQNYFMKTAGLMWEFLPERNYAALLLKICDKIESKDGTLKYDEEKSYDYRGLLKEFWYQSPERYKRYVLSNQEVTYRTNEPFETKTGVGLLIKLLTLKNFAYEDRENIKLILASATSKEKENILSSQEWRKICIEQMKEEKWETLNRFVLSCFSYKEEIDKFKRELIFTKEALRICIDFVKNDKWNAAESFIKCSALPEEEIKQLKREMIYSEDGKRACRDLVLYKEDVEVANKIFKWYFSSEEEVREFKKELIFSDVGVGGCSTLVRKDKMGPVNVFTNWCLSSQEEIKEFKKNFAHRMGDFICENLISDYSEEDIYDEQGYYTIGRTTKFNGGKWEEVEKFLTWCFSSEEEISDFKKNVLLKESGKEIHFNLIKSNQWEEAETFFAWLGLSAEEVKELKKETLFHHDAASEMFSELMYSKEDDERFVDYGSKQEAIELFLR
ncbi:MAG: hypothetical protein O7157_00915 [Wolbachia endosymbiont of Tetragnatha montana]|nr:hypothetical protein [Wolbachia endosymbiont of Tetragnatha montana]